MSRRPIPLRPGGVGTELTDRTNTVTNLQDQVQQRVDELVDSGPEIGLQVAVFKDGEQVVDAVAGVTAPATGRPVTPDTLFYSASTG